MLRYLFSVLVPESCRELKVDKAESETVSLTWQPPETDAGITKYKVLQRYLREKNLMSKHKPGGLLPTSLL